MSLPLPIIDPRPMILPQKVVFEQFEVYQFAMVGIFRCYQATKDGRQETHGSSSDSSWHRHVEGRLAEAALAKLFNRYSAGIGTIFKPDLGKCTEVRQCDVSEDRNLLVHDNDRSDCWFWFITGHHGTYIVQGFVSGATAKTFPIRELQPGRPAHCVPIKALLKSTKGIKWNQPHIILSAHSPDPKPTR